MPSNRLRPTHAVPAARRRWRALIITGLASVSCACAIGDAAEAPGIASSAGVATRTGEFPGLLDRARRETGELRAISGMNLPELGEPGSTAELDAALGNLISATEQGIARLQRERADFVMQSASADTESARLDALATRLLGEIEHARTANTDAGTEAIAEFQTASRARDETIAWQKSINQIRREITQVRNQLFPRLRHAAQRGWILPPSSYRALPVPPPAVHQKSGYSDRALSPASSPAPQRLQPDDMELSPVPLGTAPSLATQRHADVESRLDELPELLERARRAAAGRDEAIRSLAERRSQTDAQAARLTALQSQRDALASQLATAGNNLARARQASAGQNAQRASFQAMAINAWIEWGIFRWLDRKSAQLLAGGEVRSKESDFLEDWRVVAATAVQLGSDSPGVIARFPTEMTARGEALEEVRAELARAREGFGIAPNLTLSDLPAAARPYLGKEGP